MRRARHATRLAGSLLMAVLAACSDPPTTVAADGAAELRAEALRAGLAPLPLEPIRPIDNPRHPAKVDLGRLLFFDPILSGPRNVACSTCHLPRLAFADGRQFPSGAGGEGLGPERSDPVPAPLRPMPRNSPTVLNAGLTGRFSSAPTESGMFFWGGSAFGLEDQVLNPITIDTELRGLNYTKVHALDSVLLRLRSIPEYADAFARAFPVEAGLHGTAPERLIVPATLRLALAAYIRELVTPRSPYDRFLNGDTLALDAAEQRGLALFIGPAGCVRCHTGPLLSDFDLHVIGVAQEGIGRDTTPGDDLGWGEHGGVPYAFRTPPLRHVAQTAPYFHAGTAATLEDVIRFKRTGASAHARVSNSRLDPRAGALWLRDDGIADLVAFLESLTDSVTLEESLFQAPQRVPSGLEVPR